MQRVNTILALLALALLGGCAALNGEPRNAVTAISIESTPDSNHRTPVAVDIVFVHGKELAAELANISNRAWFAKKPTLLAREPDALDVVHYEITPLTPRFAVNLPQEHTRAHGVWLFSNFIGDNQAPIDLSQQAQSRIVLEKNGLRLIK